MKRNLIKIQKAVSILLFTTGILFAGWSIFSLQRYFTSANDNYLPPAGSFLNGPEKFSFAIISDSGLRNDSLHEIISDIKKKPVSFIVHLGDQARYLSTGHFESILEVMNSELADIPFYAVPGNHDGVYKNTTNLQYYKRAFGQTDYWFTFGNTLFIAINNSMSEYPQKDRDWLANVLKHIRPMFKNCILMMHVPPVDPVNEGSGMYADDQKLQKILDQYKITAILCGHIHQYMATEWAGIKLYTAPSAGQEIRGENNRFGYLLCTMGADNSFEVQNIPVTNESGREYFIFALSSMIDGILAAKIAFILLLAAFVILYSTPCKSFKEQDEK